MSAEKYQDDEVSVAVMEDLFSKLHQRAVKEFGKNWEERRLSSAVARKALYLYVQPNAEDLITEYLHADEEGHKTEEELDAEMSYDKREQTRDCEIVFEAERLSDETTAESFTSYKVRFLSGTPLDGIDQVPIKVRDKVAAKLIQAEADHNQRVSEGELEPDEAEEFDNTIYFDKHHKYVLYEPNESLEYSVKHTYSIDEHRVPMITYRPDDDPNIQKPSQAPSTPAELVTNEQMADQAQRDDMLAMFDEIMRHQDIEKPVAKRPAELRVAQIMAILAILDHGEAQNDEQEAIIKDLT